MPTKNIFAGQSARAVFAQYVYEALRRREFVSLMDVLCAYYQRDKSYYDLHTYSSQGHAPQLAHWLLYSGIRAERQRQSKIWRPTAETFRGKSEYEGIEPHSFQELPPFFLVVSAVRHSLWKKSDAVGLFGPEEGLQQKKSDSVGRIAESDLCDAIAQIRYTSKKYIDQIIFLTSL